MAKGKHVGTCQICGAHQVVTMHNEIAKHGYTVQNGWGFVGTCQGSGHTPYEISKDYIPTVIERVEANIVSSLKKIEDIKNGAVVYTSYTVYENHRPVQKLAEITLENLPAIALFSHLKHDLGFKSLSNEDKISYLKTRVCLNIQKDFGNMESFISYLKNRMETWTPRILSERVLEDNAPKLHLYTGQKAMYVACAGSCMGGMRKMGNSTEDVSKVTCPKCLEVIAKRVKKEEAKGETV